MNTVTVPCEAALYAVAVSDDPRSLTKRVEPNSAVLAAVVAESAKAFGRTRIDTVEVVVWPTVSVTV